MEGSTAKKQLINQLKEKIISMESFSTGSDNQKLDFELGEINASFPKGVFPTGAVHEFLSPTEACATVANGFLAGLLSKLMSKGGICLWVGVGRKLHPPGLKFFNLEPHRIIFVDVRLRQDALWVMEQALKCSALVAVVAEVRDVSFTESRRLQLAVEQSKVTGFIHRQEPPVATSLACVSRWLVRPLASRTPANLPGVGFPCIEVELAKIRNGKPDCWQLEWRAGAFRHLTRTKPAISFPTQVNQSSYA